MLIGGRDITQGPPLIVAELGVNHDGLRETALAMVRAAAECGVDAVKVQAFRADNFCAPDAQWNGESQAAMFRRYEMSRADLSAVAQECRRLGLLFIGTPDSLEQGLILRDYGAAALKVGSDDIVHLPLIRALAGLGLPMILSTGMATEREIDEAFRACHDRNVIALHCVSLYPTPPERANLLRMEQVNLLRMVHAGFMSGYSDHTDGIDACLAAVAMGARLIEKHFTLDRSLAGPDHSFSADLAQMRELCSRAKLVYAMMGTGEIDPDADQLAMRSIARRSIVASRPLPAGTVLAEEHLAYKRPGLGLLPSQAHYILGRRLMRDVAEDERILIEITDGLRALREELAYLAK